MKEKPELSLRMLAEECELVLREQPKVDPIALSAVWGGKGSLNASAVWGGKASGQSKPQVWTSATLSTSFTVWHASTTDKRA
jgi:hypothetical protein